MFSTITACALYLMAARWECQAYYRSDAGYCASNAAFSLYINTPRDNVAAEYHACKTEARMLLRSCLDEEVTAERVCLEGS